MHWDATFSIGNLLTIVCTFMGLIVGGFRIAVHLQRSSDAVNNLAAITERMQKGFDLHDERITAVENELTIQREVTKRVAMAAISRKVPVAPGEKVD